MVRYDEDDPLGAKTVARPDTSGSGAPPPPVKYVEPFDPADMEEGKKDTGFGDILGRNANSNRNNYISTLHPILAPARGGRRGERKHSSPHIGSFEASWNRLL